MSAEDGCLENDVSDGADFFGAHLPGQEAYILLMQVPKNSPGIA